MSYDKTKDDWRDQTIEGKLDFRVTDADMGPGYHRVDLGPVEESSGIHVQPSPWLWWLNMTLLFVLAGAVTTCVAVQIVHGMNPKEIGK